MKINKKLKLKLKIKYFQTMYLSVYSPPNNMYKKVVSHGLSIEETRRGRRMGGVSSSGVTDNKRRNTRSFIK